MKNGPAAKQSSTTEHRKARLPRASHRRRNACPGHRQPRVVEHALAVDLLRRGERCLRGVQWRVCEAVSEDASFEDVVLQLEVVLACRGCLADGIVRTTTELTTHLSNAIAGFLGLSSVENIVEYVIRAVRPPLYPHACSILIALQIFFGLNLTFNGIVSSPSLVTLSILSNTSY